MSEVKAYSDFWLNKDSLYQYVPDGDFGNDFSVDLIQLAAYRRIVSNFVFILTGKDIPVQFECDKNAKKNFTDGKSVFLSASIRKKQDFDWSIGLALHEASHILLTDFELFQNTFSRIPIPVPMTLKEKSKEKRLTEEQLAYTCKWAFNYVEDRYIDSYIFREAPGYRGYYKALYEKIWNNEKISLVLKSKAARIPNLLAYEYRVINFTNPDTDLDALPGLHDIAELIDITNITRLDTTAKRMDLSYAVVEIIVDNIKKQKQSKPSSNSTIQTVHEKLTGKVSETNLKPSEPKNNENGDGNDGESDESSPDDFGDASELSGEDLKDISKEFNKQRNVLNHKYDGIKEGVTQEQQDILETIENSNITLVPTGFGLSGDYAQAAVDSIVVRKLSRQLIDQGTNMFPLAAKDKTLSGDPGPIQYYDDAVAKGFVLGRLLGRKLQIRGEENHIKSIRKVSGKIERRLLAEIGVGMENIFNRVRTERYNKLRLHISVDASGSMQSNAKWCPTMTCVVAICVAASMVNNLEVSVSFRSTFRSHSTKGELPYVVLAYDSRTDKISKIRQLFPYLKANGATPEGLAFESIAEEFIIGKHSNEQDHYFLNISDGEPCYSVSSHSNRYGINVDYTGERGALHTKQQVEKIRRKGVKVLSYFIEGEHNPYASFGGSFYQTGYGVDKKRQLTLNETFDIMYGNDAQFIDVENVTDIARTINRLFLTKE